MRACPEPPYLSTLKNNFFFKVYTSETPLSNSGYALATPWVFPSRLPQAPRKRTVRNVYYYVKSKHFEMSVMQNFIKMQTKIHLVTPFDIIFSGRHILKLPILRRSNELPQPCLCENYMVYAVTITPTINNMNMTLYNINMDLRVWWTVHKIPVILQRYCASTCMCDATNT